MYIFENNRNGRVATAFIEQSTTMDSMYEGLPVLIVRDWLLLATRGGGQLIGERGL